MPNVNARAYIMDFRLRRCIWFCLLYCRFVCLNMVTFLAHELKLSVQRKKRPTKDGKSRKGKEAVEPETTEVW